MSMLRSTTYRPAYIALGVLLHACGDAIVEPPIDDPDLPVRVPIADILNAAIAVEPDPTGIAPLTAVLTFGTNTPVAVTTTVLGTEPLTHSFPDGQDHELAILGLYPATVNLIELRLDVGSDTFALDTIEVTTGALPDFFPTVEVITANQSQMEPGWTLSSLSIGNAGVFPGYPFMFDANGDVRWYLDLSFLGGMVFAVERFGNGNLLIARGENVYEFDMLGTEVNRWPITGNIFHHDVIEKPNGNILVAVDKVGLATVEDHVIEVDRTSGTIVTEWDLRQILDMNRIDFSGVTNDWFHMNSVWYDASDDALIISGRNQTALIKVSSNNELIWILSPHKNWGPAGVNADGHETSDFLLTAVNDAGVAYDQTIQMGDAEPGPEFRWSWGPHAAMILPNGNLFVFDNGFNRSWSSDTPQFSRGVEYAIDETAMTFRQVWQYGEERGAAFYSSNISDVDHLPDTGNRLIMPGNVYGADRRAFVTEVTYPSQAVVFEAIIHFKDMLGNGMGWGQIDLVYRSERMPIYP
jgi:arylsulfate sulfotransferase